MGLYTEKDAAGRKEFFVRFVYGFCVSYCELPVLYPHCDYTYNVISRSNSFTLCMFLRR